MINENTYVNRVSVQLCLWSPTYRINSVASSASKTIDRKTKVILILRLTFLSSDSMSANYPLGYRSRLMLLFCTRPDCVRNYLRNSLSIPSDCNSTVPSSSVPLITELSSSWLSWPSVCVVCLIWTELVTAPFYFWGPVKMSFGDSMPLGDDD